MPAGRASTLILALLRLAHSAQAADFGSWNAFDYVVDFGGRFELTNHVRTRTEEGFDRMGPMLKWTAYPRFAPLAGFYLQPQQTAPGDWHIGGRPFFGFETRSTVDRTLNLSSRFLLERWYGTSRPAYNRYRGLLRADFVRRRWTPFVHSEVFAVADGFHSSRNTGGIRVHLSPQVTLEAGYVYDFRSAAWGGNRQAIVTALRFQKPRF